MNYRFPAKYQVAVIVFCKRLLLAPEVCSINCFFLRISKMLEDHDAVGEVSIPRGGPLYVPNMVGPVTRVSLFETSIYQELQSLKDELVADSSDTWDEEISVDELKIITEDELVAKAFEEAFKAGELAEDVSQYREEDLSARPSQDLDKDIQEKVPSVDACLQDSERDTQEIVPSETLNIAHLKVINNKKSNKKSLQKRKHGDKRKNNFLDESYMVKVEEFARIKQKQEEDKASVKLHSFKGGCKSHECEAATTENGDGDKILSLKSANVSTKVKCSNTRDNIPVGSPETILCIEVYHSKKKWMKTQEFLVLGRQFLTEAKDKIYCLTDEIMKRTGKYTPGYFQIEDMFYNDMGDYTCVDYSEPILDWLENSKSDALEKWECILAGGVRQHKKNKKEILDSGKKEPLPSFKDAHMQNTRFCDIKFRLGALNLYCHQGNCKHGIVIRDMRLIHPEDIQNRAAYPIVAFQMKFRFKKCSVCKINRAQKMTFDDKWAPVYPCYFCDICFYMLHYAKQGTGDDNQVGALLYHDFSVCDYIHEIC